MRITTSCICGNNFFIEHENSCVITDNGSIHNVMDFDVPIGYKVLECVFCKKFYIGRQAKKGQFEEIIPVEEFNYEDVKKFQIRNNDRGKVKFSDEVLGKMIRR